MPNKQESQSQSQKKVSTSPSPGLLQRLFGSSELSPEMLQGIEIARRENPNLAPVQPYGPISRMALPNALAYASPGRTIYMNPSMMQGQSPEDVADTLTHEQTHVNQMNQRGGSSLMEFFRTLMQPKDPYHQRPDEMEAYGAEVARRNRMGRTQTGIPEFTTGRSIAPQNIQLFPDKKPSGINTGPSSMALRKLQGKNASK